MTRTFKGVWLPLALVAVGAMALAVVTMASAAVSSLGIGSATTTKGEIVTVDVTANATDPGIGAFTVDIAYDDSLVTLTACTSSTGLCNPAFAAHTARLVGASASGLTGAITLGTLTFQAGQTAGVANLTVTVNQLTDNQGAPVTVTPTSGTITITAPTPTPSPVPETPTPSPAPATPTPVVTAAVVPSTGGTPSDSSGVSAWLLAALGLVVVSGGVWAVARTRR